MYALMSEISPACFLRRTTTYPHACQNALQVSFCLHHVGTEKCLCKHPVAYYSYS